MPSASEVVASRLADGPARIAGAGTREWGRPVEGAVLETASLRGWEHEPGDFTVVVGAGETLSAVQARLAEEGQMLALDPPGEDGTIGGLIATADSGPLRHRYGAPRDLIIGVELALADGTVARGGGRVIKNVAGYDLPKLAAGSYGTLGVITEVAMRLHPRPSAWATAVLRFDSPEALQAAALRLSRQPLEADAFDLAWAGEGGELLVRFSGSAAADRAAALGGEVVEEDEDLWADQRARQRGDFVVRVHALPTEIARVLSAVPGIPAVGRAGVGTIWLQPPPGVDAARLKGAIAPIIAAVLDAPADRRGSDPFSLAARPERALMQAVKDRFDPNDHCNPGRLWA